MKRVLALLSLVCALVLAGACHSDVNISVKATAELNDAGTPIRIGPVLYEGFHHNHLTDNDLEDIFVDLTRSVSVHFQTAVLYLEIYDEISGKPLRDETYGVVYNSVTGHYDFADMNVIY